MTTQTFKIIPTVHATIESLNFISFYLLIMTEASQKLKTLPNTNWEVPLHFQ